MKYTLFEEIFQMHNIGRSQIEASEVLRCLTLTFDFSGRQEIMRANKR
jgi:hypothetical protein